MEIVLFITNLQEDGVFATIFQSWCFVSVLLFANLQYRFWMFLNILLSIVIRADYLNSSEINRLILDRGIELSVKKNDKEGLLKWSRSVLYLLSAVGSCPKATFKVKTGG